MVAPAAGGLLALLGKIGVGTAVSGSAADLVGIGFTIADHLKAQEGLTFSPLLFKLQNPIKNEDKTQSTPATMGVTRDKGKKSRYEAFMEEYRKAHGNEEARKILKIYSKSSVIEFALGVYPLKGPDSAIGSVNLTKQIGFDTAIGNQAEIKFDGIDLDEYYILHISGMVNPWLKKFRRFYAQLSIKLDPNHGFEIKPLAGKAIYSNGSDANSTWEKNECFTLPFEE